MVAHASGQQDYSVDKAVWLNGYKSACFPKLEKESSACARKFCFTNGARPFNQNNLKLPIDNYNKSTGGNNINDDNDNNGNSYVLRVWHFAKSFMWIISCNPS